MSIKCKFEKYFDGSFSYEYHIIWWKTVSLDLIQREKYEYTVSDRLFIKSCNVNCILIVIFLFEFQLWMSLDFQMYSEIKNSFLFWHLMIANEWKWLQFMTAYFIFSYSTFQNHSNLLEYYINNLFKWVKTFAIKMMIKCKVWNSLKTFSHITVANKILQQKSIQMTAISKPHKCITISITAIKYGCKIRSF